MVNMIPHSRGGEALSTQKHLTLHASIAYRDTRMFWTVWFCHRACLGSLDDLYNVPYIQVCLQTNNTFCRDGKRLPTRWAGNFYIKMLLT